MPPAYRALPNSSLTGNQTFSSYWEIASTCFRHRWAALPPPRSGCNICTEASSSAGAIDDSLRHCITKLSHLHLVATSEYARRVIQLGEEPWRVTVTGAPALDAIARTELLSQQAFTATFRISPSQPFLLVTFHPATLDCGDPLDQVSELLDALRSIGLPCVFTSPNLDTGGPAVLQRLEQHCRQSRADRLVRNAGQRGYFSLMSAATAMVGNSSSGIIEAPSFRLPVVNIGDRQRGRIRAGNVIDSSIDRRAIRAAIERASSPEFRQSLARLSNPFGDGRACQRIIEALASRIAGNRADPEDLSRRRPKSRVRGAIPPFPPGTVGLSRRPSTGPEKTFSRYQRWVRAISWRSGTMARRPVAAVVRLMSGRLRGGEPASLCAGNDAELLARGPRTGARLGPRC